VDVQEVMHAEERSSAAIRLEIEEVDAEDESQSDFSDRSMSDIEMDDEPGRNRSLKRAAGRQSSGVRRRKRRSCQSVPYLSMLEPATPHDFPLLLSPLSALPERTAAVDYSESQVAVVNAMPSALVEWEDERIALYDLESTTRQMTGIIRMQKDVLKDSQRQLTDARQTTAKVDEQLRQARREMQLMRNKQAAELRVAGISPAAEKNAGDYHGSTDGRGVPSRKLRSGSSGSDVAPVPRGGSKGRGRGRPPSRSRGR